MGDPLHALFSGINLLENEKVQAIIGPQTSEEVELLVRLGDKAEVPIVSFSATSPFLSQVKTPYFVRVATNNNSQHSLIPPSATEDCIGLELYKLKTMSTTVFIVHMSALASKFFLKVKEVGMMSEGYAWIITDGVKNNLNSLDYSVINSMQGVIGIRPYTLPSKKLDNLTMKWKNTLQEDNQNNDVNVFCLWAYDAVWALANAAEKVGPANHY
ncbi:hypothetical protein GH714_005978 [Hevea brasiliensis]|uniref:Receptor ligand binding region domain-containing protein n=1 Tax=Hevea brasiliensis TaxID=3981 RepID=A0A6A6M8H2_HEVBR|nr:hypothetical protein GH714_005978 [Hevea brasiliensis]